MTSIRWKLKVEKSVQYYCLEGLSTLEGVRHGFSTRLGRRPDDRQDFFSLSAPPGEPRGYVEQNRNLYLSCLEFPVSSLRTLKQVHSNRIVFLNDKNDGSSSRPTGDAFVTQVPGLVISVSTADCYPVLLVDPVRRVVGAVHAGWRGTAAGIVAKTVQAIHDRYSSEPQDMVAMIGPGIGPCCYQVGSNVFGTFQEPSYFLADKSDPEDPRWRLNLAAANRQQLVSSSVLPENIYLLGICTSCDWSRFFSYRRDGHATGRMLSVIGLVY